MTNLLQQTIDTSMSNDLRNRVIGYSGFQPLTGDSFTSLRAPYPFDKQKLFLLKLRLRFS